MRQVFKVLVAIAGAIVAVCVALELIFDLLTYVGIDWMAEHKLQRLHGVFFIAAISFFLGTLILVLRRDLVLRKDIRNNHDGYNAAHLSKALIAEFQTMAECRDYQTILRIGKGFSRALWLEGQYLTRLEIGRIVEDAAGHIGDIEVQVQALIDDIGWTLVTLGNLKHGEESIRRGITIAEKHSLAYYGAKGHRHLAGISIQSRHPKEAAARLASAEIFVSQMQEGSQKTEMLAGIRYGQAEAALLSEDAQVLNQAERWCLEARQMYVNVKEEQRAVKTYAQYGKIAERKGELLEAKDIYRQGLELAERLDRRDEIIRNHLGLGRVANALGDRKEARLHLSKAKDMQRQTPILFELESSALQPDHISSEESHGTN